jgi:hypothetical protein
MRVIDKWLHNPTQITARARVGRQDGYSVANALIGGAFGFYCTGAARRDCDGDEEREGNEQYALLTD